MCKSIPEEVSFVLSHYKILSSDSKQKTPSESTPEEFLNKWIRHQVLSQSASKVSSAEIKNKSIIKNHAVYILKGLNNITCFYKCL